MTQDDLTYLRELAASGDSGPNYGGRFYVLWGVLVALAMALHGYSVQSGFGAANPLIFPAIWIAFAILGITGNIFFGRAVRALDMSGSVSNRLDAAVWQGVALGIFAFVAGLAAFIIQTGQSPLFWDLIVPVAFLFYAVAFFVNARMGGSAMNVILAIVAFAGAIFLMTWVGTATLYFIASALAVIIMVVPGLLLLARERAA